MALNQYGWFLDGHPGSGVTVVSYAVLAAGAYYWEVTTDIAAADGTNGYGLHSGVCTAALQLTGTFASAVNIAQGPGGAFINWRAANPVSDCNGWGSPTRMGGIPGGEPFATGEKIAFALDTIHKKLWVRNVSRSVPAGGWGGGVGTAGNPATNTDGADLAALGLTGPLYIVCGASHGFGANKGVGTINFGASAFTGTVPTGFVSVESVFPGAKLNPNDASSNLVLSNGDLTFAGTNVPVSFSPAIGGFTTNVGYSSSVRSRFAIAM